MFRKFRRRRYCLFFSWGSRILWGRKCLLSNPWEMEKVVTCRIKGDRVKDPGDPSEWDTIETHKALLFLSIFKVKVHPMCRKFTSFIIQFWESWQTHSHGLTTVKIQSSSIAPSPNFPFASYTQPLATIGFFLSLEFAFSKMLYKWKNFMCRFLNLTSCT